MQRGELLLTLVLATILLAGIGYESLRGADKNAEIIIARTGKTPFDATRFDTQPTPLSPSSSAQKSAFSPPISLPETQPETSLRLIAFLNHASLTTMQELPGIGPVTAQRILDKRNEIGSFTRIEELMEISGIGKAKLNHLLDAMKSKSSPLPFAVPSSQSSNRPLLPRPIPTATPAMPPPSLRALNQATREELMKISGIGESLADAILQARTKMKGFRSWDDVDSVSGIGEHRLEQIQNHFDPPRKK